jgi:hypothetical protein
VDLDYAVLADGVVGRPDGKLDILGAGFDTIWALAVPAQHARLVLATRALLSREEIADRHTLDVVIRMADGTELARGHAELNPVPEDSRPPIPEGRPQVGAGLVLNFDNIVFPAYGQYQIALLWDGEEVRPPLILTVAPPPPPQS